MAAVKCIGMWLAPMQDRFEQECCVHVSSLCGRASAPYTEGQMHGRNWRMFCQEERGNGNGLKARYRSHSRNGLTELVAKIQNSVPIIYNWEIVSGNQGSIIGFDRGAIVFNRMPHRKLGT